jgi:hypothetical protein
MEPMELSPSSSEASKRKRSARESEENDYNESFDESEEEEDNDLVWVSASCGPSVRSKATLGRTAPTAARSTFKTGRTRRRRGLFGPAKASKKKAKAAACSRSDSEPKPARLNYQYTGDGREGHKKVRQYLLKTFAE